MTPKTQQTSYSLDEVMQMYGAAQPTVQPSIQAAQTASNPYNALFRATGNEGAISAGFKAAGNYPTSAYTTGKAVATAIASPIETGKGVFDLVRSGGAKLRDVAATGIDKLTGSRAGSIALGKGATGTAPIEAVGEMLNERVGTSFGPGKFDYDTFLDRSSRTAIEDPFGVGTSLLGIVTGTAGALGKGAAVSRGISTVGNAVASPLGKTASGFSEKVASSVRFGVSQATGLSPETISTVARNRGAFSKAQAEGMTRTDLAENVLGAVQKASDELSDLGTGYDTIRKTSASIALPENWVQSSLDKYGLKFDNTRVSADRTSATRNTTDINKIQEFIDNWGDARTLTPDEYLNMRHDLAELAKYDMSGKSTVVRQFAQDVREGMLNSDDVRNQVPGLKELDTQYAADRTFLSKIEKDFIDPKTGNLKDGAASKVVNSINAANPERLARLEKLYPGFTQQAKVVKAIEDIENSMGIKTGTYVRAGVGVGAAVTGNLPVVVAAILSTPEIAIPLIKGYGWTAEQVAPVLKAARDVASDINNFRVPGAVQKYLEEKYPNGVPVGMSTQAVGITGKDLDTAETFIDYMEGVKKIPKEDLADLKFEAQRVAEAVGIDNTLGDKALANALRKQLDKQNFSKAKGATPQTTALLEEVKKYVYHGTNESVLDNIRKEGLKPGRRGQLSVSTDESYAKSFAFPGKTPTGETKPILFRIKKDILEGKTTTKRLDKKERPKSDQDFELLTSETIPPEAIEIWEDGRWVPLVN